MFAAAKRGNNSETWLNLIARLFKGVRSTVSRSFLPVRCAAPC